MCNGASKESLEQLIELPDDEADGFGCMLECMYIHAVSHRGEAANLDVKADMLADAYVLAEKYQLNDLKKLLFNALEAILDGRLELRR